MEQASRVYGLSSRRQRLLDCLISDSSAGSPTGLIRTVERRFPLFQQFSVRIPSQIVELTDCFNFQRSDTQSEVNRHQEASKHHSQTIISDESARDKPRDNVFPVLLVLTQRISTRGSDRARSLGTMKSSPAETPQIFNPLFNINTCSVRVHFRFRFFCIVLNKLFVQWRRQKLLSRSLTSILSRDCQVPREVFLLLFMSVGYKLNLYSTRG